MKKQNVRWLIVFIMMLLVIILVSAVPANAAAVVPKVSATIPANGTTGVDIKSTISATFRFPVPSSFYASTNSCL